MDMETKREVVEGFLYESSSGQLVIDTHPSDEQHLRSRATHTEQPLHRCRTYVRDLVPKGWLNTRGKILVDRTVTKYGETVQVAISFIPFVEVT